MSAPRSRPATGRIILAVYMVLFFAYLESPLVVIVVSSFNAGATLSFPPTGFSFRWYHVLWNVIRELPGTKPGLAAAIWTSVWVGFASMAGAVMAGTLAAFGLRRYRFPGREILGQCLLLPLLFPQVVVGIGLALWFSQIGGVPTWLRLLTGHLILTLPYVIVTTTASLETLDQRLEDAAMNLGANRFATFWHITVPGIRSGIITGALFAWLVSFSNFTVSFFLYSGGLEPVPPWLYEVIQYYIDPSIAALSTLLVVVTLLGLLMIDRMSALGRLVGLRR